MRTGGGDTVQINGFNGSSWGTWHLASSGWGSSGAGSGGRVGRSPLQLQCGALLEGEQSGTRHSHYFCLSMSLRLKHFLQPRLFPLFPTGPVKPAPATQCCDDSFSSGVLPAFNPLLPPVCCLQRPSDPPRSRRPPLTSLPPAPSPAGPRGAF